MVFLKSSDSAIINPKKNMNVNLVTQLIVATCFCLTSIFLRHFSVVGFQLLVTGLLNVLFAVGTFWVINKQPDSLSVGACLGSGVIISLLSLVTAVHWGELSHCEVLSVAVRKYTCDSKDAMRVLCFFSIILFLLQVCSLSSWNIDYLCTRKYPRDFSPNFTLFTDVLHQITLDVQGPCIGSVTAVF